MHGKKIIGFIIAVLLSSCMPEAVSEFNPKILSNDNQSEIVPEALLLMLEDGDIILKMGYGPLSLMIAEQMQEPVRLSHCGIVVKQEDSLYIIHSVAKEISGKDGVQTISLGSFYKDTYPGSLIISRVKNGEAEKKAISRMAQDYLSRRIPFDYEFSLESKDRMYCSELVHQVLWEVYHRDFFQYKTINQKSILTFNSLIDTAGFNFYRFNPAVQK
jgi:hypothetical protein